MAKTRTAVAPEDKWNVEVMFKSYDEWEREMKPYNSGNPAPHWPEIAIYKGKLAGGPDNLKKLLDAYFEQDRKLSTLYTYAHLRHDEDITHEQHKSGFTRIQSIYHDFNEETSWIIPEILALSNIKIEEYLQSPALKEYHFHLKKIVRIKEHTLSPECEALLALSGKALETPSRTFSSINNADFKFGNVQDSKGQEHELTHGSYSLHLHGRDRTLRKNAFKQLHQKYAQYENTLCELIQGQVQKHLFEARARRYSSCLEAALFPKNIDTGVFYNLIQTVNEGIEPLHRYVKYRKKKLGLDEIHPYDMYVPLVSEVDIKMSYLEAEEVTIDAVKPLGSDYQNFLREGLKAERWVDRYENDNKRSGAYSSGCYDSMPYILMNYKGILRDVFTLAHEAGHSMHSLLSHKHQPYQYSQYPIFLAEVASTFNEQLLTDLLLERSKTKEERTYLINQQIEDIRATFFRQVMFAEFELTIHEMVEKNVPLTPPLLKQKFRKLNAKYFGPEMVLDDELDIEWARIPHFYYNFYVYQYATGISAAIALAEKVKKGGQKEREDYLDFLKGGSSAYPIDLLQHAGVNMLSPEPVKATLKKFDSLVRQLEKEEA